MPHAEILSIGGNHDRTTRLVLLEDFSRQIDLMLLAVLVKPEYRLVFGNDEISGLEHHFPRLSGDPDPIPWLNCRADHSPRPFGLRPRSVRPTAGHRVDQLPKPLRERLQHARHSISPFSSESAASD